MADRKPLPVLTREHVDAVRAMLLEDNIIIDKMPESPYLRIGFHIAATYDRHVGGGWNMLWSRHELKEQGLLDDILLVYWDILLDYFELNQHRMHGMSKADYLSFVIYLYCLKSTYSPNITWRAGRSDPLFPKNPTERRPHFQDAMYDTYKPEPAMNAHQLRLFFARVGIQTDEEIVLLMAGHTYGSARGFPYLGEFADSSGESNDLATTSRTSTCDVWGCYYKHLLTFEWEVGCPTFCSTCMWSATWADKYEYNERDPYNTTWIAAPSNYTKPQAWGKVCEANLAKRGLVEYRNVGGENLMRLPVDIALLEDQRFRSIMVKYVGEEHRTQFGLDFGRAYSKLLEVGVPEEHLYEVVRYTANVPHQEGY
uniref:Plant heme peroxidase family profile domain-containing protein n=1 Tax=Noctiluca scintillans TaxID=2966 RepID=A0A7S1A4W1_NOCSC